MRQGCGSCHYQKDQILKLYTEWEESYAPVYCWIEYRCEIHLQGLAVFVTIMTEAMSVPNQLAYLGNAFLCQLEISANQGMCTWEMNLFLICLLKSYQNTCNTERLSETVSCRCSYLYKLCYVTYQVINPLSNLLFI